MSYLQSHNNWSAFRLTGLMVGCSIPPAIVSSLLPILAFVAVLIGLHWFITWLSSPRNQHTNKEVNMNKTDNPKASKPKVLTLSTLNTVWAMGTSVAAGALQTGLAPSA